MAVKHALLALLAERDLTGYELKSRFERALGDFWQLNSGQVYSTLERLRRGGLVVRRSENATVERTRYTITPSGRRQFERWITTPLPRLRPVRDPLYVKLVFCPLERLAELLGSLDGETRRYTEAHDTLGALVARQPLSVSGRTRWLVAEAARLVYEAQLTWLATTRRLLAAEAQPQIQATPIRPTRLGGANVLPSTMRLLPTSANGSTRRPPLPATSFATRRRRSGA